MVRDSSSAEETLRRKEAKITDLQRDLGRREHEVEEMKKHLNDVEAEVRGWVYVRACVGGCVHAFVWMFVRAFVCPCMCDIESVCFVKRKGKEGDGRNS